MSSYNVKKKLQQKRQRSFLTKDFDAYKSEMLKYAGLYYGDKIKDFTPGSVGSLLLDFVAHVGDVTSFYLDHQFGETNLETAVETKNLERLIRLAGVKIRGSSPAFVEIDFTLKIDVQRTTGGYLPIASQLPVIKSGTKVESSSGVKFELLDDLDFAQVDLDGNLLASISTYSSNDQGRPVVFLVTRRGLCTSGTISEEKFVFGSSSSSFKTISLANSNVNEIIRVIDTESNEYSEVESLSHDVVYKRVSNLGNDRDDASDSLVIVPAPYRFITRSAVNNSITTIIFGSGDASSLDDDILPDPSEVSIPLFGDRKVFPSISLDPNSILGSRSLGVTPMSTTITIRYRHGGGLNHNTAAGTIKKVSSLTTKFNNDLTSTKISSIRSSITVNNVDEARGGEDAPTIEDLRSIALNYRNSQNRIVSKEDLIARCLVLPANFGRTFRLGIRSNPVNPLSSLLFTVNRDANGKLKSTPDVIKRNLATYINQYRLISDSIDILDAQIINLNIVYNVVLDARVDRTSTLVVINNALKDYFNIKNFQIDQPIFTGDIINLILNQDGVLSIDRYKISTLNGIVSERVYSNIFFDINAATKRGVITPPAGGIFELKFPDSDIIGNAV